MKIDDGTCALCQKNEENVDHLFFSCNFTSKVWIKVQQLCLVNRDIKGWTEEVQWLCCHLNGYYFTNQLRRLSLAVPVYRIWLAQNMKIYKGVRKSEKQIVEEIVDEVNTIVSTWKGIQPTNENWKIMMKRGISHDCFRRQ